MNKKEFDAIVNDAVAAGADRKDAEAYVRSGFKIDDDATAAAEIRSAGKMAAKRRTPAAKRVKKRTDK